MAETLAFLTQCEGNRQVTLAACQLLEKAGVLACNGQKLNRSFFDQC